MLGQCAPGRTAVVDPAGNLFGDNPQYTTQPIASASSPAATDNFSGLYLQAVLVKVNSAATLERVRTYLVTHTAQSASGTAPRTFGEASPGAREASPLTVQRLVYIAVALTLIVAGCSLAVAVGGSLIERKRPFTLLRLTGTATSTLYRVVVLEACCRSWPRRSWRGIAYGMSVLTVGKMAPAGTPMPVPGHAYFLTMAAGLIASLLVILASLPLLGRVTGSERVRFE